MTRRPDWERHQRVVVDGRTVAEIRTECTHPAKARTVVERVARADVANALLRAIAGCGRHFFAHRGSVSHFAVDPRGRIWYIDAYAGARIYTHYRGRWRGFSGGGTLRALVERLCAYIARGTQLPVGIFGPWPEWVCGGDLWAYGDDMQRVRQAAAELGVIPRTACGQDVRRVPSGRDAQPCRVGDGNE